MTKSSLTMRDPSPMYFCTNSLPETRMKVQSVWCATARASRVFPSLVARTATLPAHHTLRVSGQGAQNPELLPCQDSKPS